jgi:RNA polymerase sigma-70 factor (ECF subfamily)
MLRDRAAAEDVAQETLLRAWLGREQMREEDLGAWLSVVARNLCISYIRKQKKAVPTEVLPETPDESADPAHVVTTLERRRAVRRAMRQVGGRQSALLFRREIEGADYEELSAELGLTVAGTRTVMFRARQMLRDRLAAAGEGVGAWVIGVRIRVREVWGNASRIADAAGATVLQAGLALMIATGLSVGGSGVAAPAPAMMLSRPRAVLHRDVRAKSFPVHHSTAVTGKPLTSLPAGGGPDNSHFGTTIHRDGNVDGPGVRTYNQPHDNPLPYDGSISQTAIDTTVGVVCGSSPDTCDAVFDN